MVAGVAVGDWLLTKLEVVVPLQLVLAACLAELLAPLLKEGTTTEAAAAATRDPMPNDGTGDRCDLALVCECCALEVGADILGGVTTGLAP